MDETNDQNSTAGVSKINESKQAGTDVNPTNTTQSQTNISPDQALNQQPPVKRLNLGKLLLFILGPLILLLMIVSVVSIYFSRTRSEPVRNNAQESAENSIIETSGDNLFYSYKEDFPSNITKIFMVSTDGKTQQELEKERIKFTKVNQAHSKILYLSEDVQISEPLYIYNLETKEDRQLKLGGRIISTGNPINDCIWFLNDSIICHMGSRTTEFIFFDPDLKGKSFPGESGFLQFLGTETTGAIFITRNNEVKSISSTGLVETRAAISNQNEINGIAYSNNRIAYVESQDDSLGTYKITNLTTGETKQIFTFKEGELFPIFSANTNGFSSDGKLFVFSTQLSNGNSVLYVYNTETNQIRETIRTAKLNDQKQIIIKLFAPFEKETLYYLEEEALNYSDFQVSSANYSLKVLDLATNKSTEIAKPKINPEYMRLLD